MADVQAAGGGREPALARQSQEDPQIVPVRDHRRRRFVSCRNMYIWSSDLSTFERPRSRYGSVRRGPDRCSRSEEHTSELQSLMRISYAVFCLKTKIEQQHHVTHTK